MGIFEDLKNAALRAEYERQRMIERSEDQSDALAMRLAKFNRQGKDVRPQDIALQKEMFGMAENMAGATSGITRFKKEAVLKGLTKPEASAADKILRDRLDPEGTASSSWVFRDTKAGYEALKEFFKKLNSEDKKTLLNKLSKEKGDIYRTSGTVDEISAERGIKSPFSSGIHITPSVFSNRPLKDLGKFNTLGVINDRRRAAENASEYVSEALGKGSYGWSVAPSQFKKIKAANLGKEKVGLEMELQKNFKKPLKAASKEAMMPMVDYERKALDIYAKGVQKNRDIIYGSEKLDALKQEQKELMKYVKEKAKALKNYKKNIEAYAKKPLSPEVGYTPDITPSPAAPLSPQASPEQVSNMIEAYTKQAGTVGGLNRELRNLNQEAIKKVDDYDQWIKNFIGDFGVPVNQKAPTPTQEAIENLSKWPTPDEVAAADRMRRFKEIEAASEKPASSITGAGTLLKPNQRAGYQKWQAAQKGMKINFKKGK